MLYFVYGMVLFLLAACKHDAGKIELVWKNDKAVGVKIPVALAGDITQHPIHVVITEAEQGLSILGNFTTDGDAVLFEPLIPLTAGMSYEIWQEGKVIGKVVIPSRQGETPPQLVAIYPEKDTLPENTLKLYFHFSKPMRTGQVLDHIYILDQKKDTMRNVFLNLQPELWDTSGTVLTLWLDPGRIKRGLVLNKELGNPLKRSEKYRLVVSQNWNDTHGISLTKSYTKQFVAGGRDAQMPNVNDWPINAPVVGSTRPLVIVTQDHLDHYLLQECIEVIDSGGAVVKGTVAVSDKDNRWQFTPSQPWKAGQYKLRVDAKLEDLAGNNLNRIFDRDITKDTQKNKAYFERGFEVR